MTKKVLPTSIRIPPSLKEALEVMAEKEGRSFNNLVNRILEKATKEEGK